MISQHATLEEIQSIFSTDRFATEAAGCRICQAAPGSSVCIMDIENIHRNAMGNVMGGALFTLADFALAVAANIGEEPTVSVDHTISFLRASKGTTLRATASCDKPGHHLAFYSVIVEDNLGKQIARMTATCYR